MFPLCDAHQEFVDSLLAVGVDDVALQRERRCRTMIGLVLELEIGFEHTFEMRSELPHAGTREQPQRNERPV